MTDFVFVQTKAAEVRGIPCELCGSVRSYGMDHHALIGYYVTPGRRKRMWPPPGLRVHCLSCEHTFDTWRIDGEPSLAGDEDHY